MEEQLKIDFEKLLENSNFSKKNVEIKRKNFDNFIEKGFPNRREENWKFSDLNQIISKNIKNLSFYNDLSKPNKIDHSIFSILPLTKTSLLCSKPSIKID